MRLEGLFVGVADVGFRVADVYAWIFGSHSERLRILIGIE